MYRTAKKLKSMISIACVRLTQVGQGAGTAREQTHNTTADTVVPVCGLARQIESRAERREEEERD